MIGLQCCCCKKYFDYDEADALCDDCYTKEGLKCRCDEYRESLKSILKIISDGRILQIENIARTVLAADQQEE